MKIELEISDFISQDEMKAIAKDELIRHLREIVKREADRLLSNTAYYSSFSFLNEIFTDEQREIVKQKVTEILNNPTSYSVFYKSYYERDSSPAIDIMYKTIHENRDTIINTTKKIITDYNYQEKLETDCMDILKDAIIKKLSHTCEE